MYIGLPLYYIGIHNYMQNGVGIDISIYGVGIYNYIIFYILIIIAVCKCSSYIVCQELFCEALYFRKLMYISNI